MCDLCKLDRITKWHRVRHGYIILDCKVCNVPMMVLKQHKMILTKDEEEILENECKHFGDIFYGKDEYYVDKKQNTILDHLHYHIRPKDKE
ncbi:MAG: hypothetical protein QF864_06505 [SAR202 cluster bacterium]|jgi:hypothetical protein|nr:hypothetical protein [SAR202 cluster bacterium]